MGNILRHLLDPPKYIMSTFLNTYRNHITIEYGLQNRERPCTRIKNSKWGCRVLLDPWRPIAVTRFGKLYI